MLGQVRNLMVSNIHLKQSLPRRESEWLVRQLRSRPGIAAARCEADARYLVVEYDADELVSGDVVEFLSLCGVRVAAVRRPGFGPKALPDQPPSIGEVVCPHNKTL